MKEETHISLFEEIGDFLLLQTIGQGSFATVRVASNQYTKSYAAVKIIKKKNVTEEKFKRELLIMKDLDHPFICKFFQFFENESCYYIFMEHIDGCSLLEYMNNNGILSEYKIKHFFCQLLSILSYLHNEKLVAHRDIKVENILIDKNNNIRIIDFGLSNVFITPNGQLKTAVGSPAYASPEMLKGENYNSKADIWSAGVVLYTMLYGFLPFQDQNVQRLLQKIVQFEPKFPHTCSEQAIDLLKKMLCKDPNKRISLEQISNHPFLQNNELFPTFQNKLKNLKKLYDSEEFYNNIQEKTLKICLNINENSQKIVFEIFKRSEIIDKMKDYFIDENFEEIPSLSYTPNKNSNIHIPLPSLINNGKETLNKDVFNRRRLSMTSNINSKNMKRSRALSFTTI